MPHWCCNACLPGREASGGEDQLDPERALNARLSPSGLSVRANAARLDCARVRQVHCMTRVYFSCKRMASSRV